MSSPSWLRYLLAAVMIVTAVYCVSRLAAARLRGRPAEPDVDIVHVLMGVAMAGMLVPRLRSLPDGAWEAAFGAAVAWFGWQAIRAHRAGGSAAHCVPHVLASGAMVYMFLAAPLAGTGPAWAGVVMDGQSAASIRFPVLALALAVALFGYVMWVTDRLPSVPAVAVLRLASATAVPGWPGTGSRSGTGAHSGIGSRPGIGSRSGIGSQPRTGSQPGMGTQPGLAAAAATGRTAAPPAAAPGLAGQAAASRPRPVDDTPLSPRLAACCEIVMGLTMGYMLILML
jgi:hypothetical protein